MKKKNLLLLSVATLFALNLCGQTWTHQTTPTPLGTLEKIQFIDSLKGWSVGDMGACIFTNNGSVVWGNQYPPVASNEEITALHFINVNYGFAAYSAPGSSYPSNVIKTSNGGTLWSFLGYGLTGATHIYSLFFTDSLHGLAGGRGTDVNNGRIYKTSNGGVSWTQITFPGTNYIFQIQMVIPAVGFASSTGTIFSTIDSGIR